MINLRIHILLQLEWAWFSIVAGGSKVTNH